MPNPVTRPSSPLDCCAKRRSPHHSTTRRSCRCSIVATTVTCGSQCVTSTASTLTVSCGRSARPPRHECARIVTSVAHGLDYAHSRGVVHRDVKPANILIRSHADWRGRAFITDFGIASAADARTRLTAPGTMIGSIEYAAPERLLNHTPDGRADQYSLACSAFYLLTGSHPFPRKGLTAIVSAHLGDAPESVRWHDETLSPVVDEVVCRAMSKKPGDRYESCRAFAADLATALTAVGGPPAVAARRPRPAVSPLPAGSSQAPPGPRIPSNTFPADTPTAHRPLHPGTRRFDRPEAPTTTIVEPGGRPDHRASDGRLAEFVLATTAIALVAVGLLFLLLG